MATVKCFEDLQSWQLARELSKEIYVLTSRGSFAKDFDLRSQIRRASGSIMDNIAEGFERNGKGELLQFLSIAKGSAGEVRSQLYRALDQQYIDQPCFTALTDRVVHISRLIANFMTYLKKSDLKGSKYMVSEDEIPYLAGEQL